MAGTAQYVNRAAFEDGSGPVFGASAEQWDFSPGSDIVKSQPIIGTMGLMGSRTMDTSRSRFGPYTVAGSLQMDGTETGVSPAFLSKWLPRVWGGGTATSPTMANALFEFGVLADRGGDIYRYLGCVANRLRIGSSANQLVSGTLDILGKTETAGQTWGGSIPVLGSSVAYEPLQHADLVLTISSVARTVLAWEMVWDNNVRARHANALSADAMIAGQRMVTFMAKVPFTSTEAAALYGLTKNGVAGATALLTNTTVSALFTLAQLQIPDNTARTENGEVVLTLQGQIRGTALGAEMTGTMDIT